MWGSTLAVGAVGVVTVGSGSNLEQHGDGRQAQGDGRHGHEGPTADQLTWDAPHEPSIGELIELKP